MTAVWLKVVVYGTCVKYWCIMAKHLSGLSWFYVRVATEESYFVKVGSLSTRGRDTSTKNWTYTILGHVVYA